MDLKELIEYYDENFDKIHTESKHYDILLLMRSKKGGGKVEDEPHINGKHYWINSENFKDNRSHDFFYVKDVNTFRIIFDGIISFSAHIGVICSLGRENFGTDILGGYFIQNKKKVRDVNKIAKLCTDKLKRNYDCLIEPCKDGIFKECVLFDESLANQYVCADMIV